MSWFYFKTGGEMAFKEVIYVKRKKDGTSEQKEAFLILNLPNETLEEYRQFFGDKVRCWFDHKNGRLLAKKLQAKKITPEEAQKRLDKVKAKRERYLRLLEKSDQNEKLLQARVNGA